MRFLLAATFSATLIVACSERSNDDAAAATSNVEKTATTGSQLVPFLTKDAAFARAAAFNTRHPGWKTTAIDRLTGAISFAGRGDEAPTTPVLSDAELLTKARTWLLADADVHGITPADLLETESDFGGDERGYGASVVERRRVIFWAPRTRPGYEAFPELNARFEVLVEISPAGVPRSVQMGLGPDIWDSRHLPQDLALTIGTTPTLASSDPRVVKDVVGRPLKVYRPSQHDLLGLGEVLADDPMSFAPTLALAKEETGIRLTMAYRVTVSKRYVDPATGSTRTATFDYVVNGATGAMIDDNAFCTSGVQEAAWCEYQSAYARDPFPRVDPIRTCAPNEPC